MALTTAAVKAIIKAKREAQFGPPDDPDLADASYTADAEAIEEILKTLAVVTLNNGADSGGDTLLDLTGAIS